MNKILVFAVAVFLLSCADDTRDNPYDERAVNYIGKSSAEGSSSSVEAGEPSSSSGDEELSSSSEDVSSSSEEALSSSSAETGDNSSSSGEAESSSSVAPSSSSAEPSSSSALPSSSSEAESSSSVAPSSNSVAQEPINAGNPLSFTNADYTDENGKKYYWLGTTPEVQKDWIIQNVESARCDVTIGTRGVRYEQSQNVWDINNPGEISICAKAVCNQESKTLECAEAEIVSNPSLSGTCDWTETGESPVIAPEDIIPQIDISILNNYGRCEEDIHLSFDGATTVGLWQEKAGIITNLWSAETANMPIGIKAYAKCSGSLIGGIACPDITKKTKNPKATGYIVDDRDDQIYQIVEIGEQTWMAENLNFGSYCYNNSDSNCNTYGSLYGWLTAMGCNNSSLCFPSGKHKGICPSGWHIPSQAELEVMTETIGGAATGGKKLKAMSGWNDYNGASGNGTDDYGFSALPGGQNYPGTSASAYYNGIGTSGYWWSSSWRNETAQYGRYYSYNTILSVGGRDNFTISEYQTERNPNNSGVSYPPMTLSVRCVKD